MEASARGIGLPVSTKHAVEVCNFIRHKNVEKTKKLLARVVNKKVAIPFKKYNNNVGHKPGIGPGRYPIKAVKEVLKLINSAESNAKQKGMELPNLFIIKATASKGQRILHTGRKMGQQMKRTHIEISLKEIQKKK